MLELPKSLNPLQAQLLEAAERFATDAQPLGNLLTAMVQDVERVMTEPLEIFPVCHHSPASALHLVQRLRHKAPQVIYIELCEDLLPIVADLRDCKLPVALQAFASESETYLPEQMPLSVVAPLTEASAEYQAIAYALQHPETQLVFVDRAIDFVFQWQAQGNVVPSPEAPQSDDAETQLHGSAVGVEVGNLTPTFDQFLEFLLHNSNTRHFAEWWDQYVEQALIGADYDTYRQVMSLVGSLMRRLGRRDRETIDQQRERYMWTRMKQHLTANQLPPESALYICGAAHIASPVAEFGTQTALTWEIPDRTATKWLYGLIPSSFVAIEHQFALPSGTVSLAESTWKKSLKASTPKPFDSHTSSHAQTLPPPNTPSLSAFLTRPPHYAAVDTDQLLQWCAEIVALARKNGYLATTADSIAIYETAILLANLRHRPHPTPYDFQDAAITCLEKDRTPKKRNVEQICKILLGGDRIGVVGYASLPPLAQDVYDRLAPLKVNLLAQTNQRALMDLKQQSALLSCSDVLWRLNYLVGDRLVQPIMGERSLGHTPIQESWEIRIGKHQRDLIMLGYEGVTLEQVLERQLRRAAFDAQSHASTALAAAEDSVLLLNHPRLTEELGEQAIALLSHETGAEDAPQIFERVRRLVHYYRTTPAGLPTWIERFVATGYCHYATLLPKAFGDRGTTPAQIAGMLGFIFTLESLALSLGCQRSQLLIGINQAAQEESDPAKLGLLWTTEWLLNLRTLEQMREFFDHVLNNPLLIQTFPDYLNGFILALNFAPRISRFVVELLSKLFASVPDSVLLPWLPSLVLRLRSHAPLLQTLIKEAATSFPPNLSGFQQWTPFWHTQPTANATSAAISTTAEQEIHQLLLQYPESLQAIASVLC
ncbi:MAG TPA: DUF5682 family protein [Trichocoleus sp.]|jgi:hypothetical protein